MSYRDISHLKLCSCRAAITFSPLASESNAAIHLFHDPGSWFLSLQMVRLLRVELKLIIVTEHKVAKALASASLIGQVNCFLTYPQTTSYNAPKQKMQH